MLDVIVYEGSESMIAGIVIGFVFTLITGITLMYLYKKRDYGFLRNVRDDEL